MTQPNPKLLRDVQAIPRAIEPAFQLSLDSNAAVVLWNGTLDITQGSVTEQGSAEIRWVWLPYPRVEFTCTLTGFSQISVRQSIHVNSPGSFVDSDGLIFHKLYDGANTLLTGSLKQVQYGRDQELQSVVFHLPNFYPYLGNGIRGDIAIEGENASCQNWAGRLVFEDDEYRVILDALDGTLGDPKFFQTLRNSRGSGFTHVGKIERIDGAQFRPFHAERLLESLNVWFTLCRGLNCYALLPVGFATTGNRVWESWQATKVDQNGGFDSWFPQGTYKDFAPLKTSFREFRKLWADESWRDALKIIAEWYAETNHAATLDTAIVNNQVGLELLAWVILVEQGRSINATAFADHIKAFERLRLLNVWIGLNSDIPSTLTHLSGIAANRQWEDGPKAITEMRNAVVHPNLRQRALTTSPDERLDTRDLGVWYFELAILKLLNYRGQYWTRVSRAASGNGLVVPPWMI